MYKQKYITYKTKYTQNNKVNTQLNNNLYNLLTTTRNVTEMLKRYKKGFIDMTGLNEKFFEYYDLILQHQEYPKKYSRPILNFIKPKEFFNYNLLGTHSYYFPEWKKQNKINNMEQLIKNNNYYEYGSIIIKSIEEAISFYQRYI